MKIDEAFSRHCFVRLDAPVILIIWLRYKLNEQEKLDWWIRLRVKTAKPLLSIVQKLACCDLSKRSLIWSQMTRGRIWICFYFQLHIFLFISLDRELRGKNVSVNLWVVNERWLFSLLWCTGASSVTTNACHIFKNMSKPDWHLVNLSLSSTYHCLMCHRREAVFFFIHNSHGLVWLCNTSGILCVFVYACNNERSLISTW